MIKRGCVPATIYFRHADGHLSLAPFTDCPTPPDAIREEADTILAVTKLEKILVQQEVEKAARENEADYKRIEARHQEIRDRLYQRSISSATTDYEREFIKLALALRDEEKIKRYQQRLLEYQTFHLHALHYDLGKRDAAKEEFKWEKHDG